MPRTTVKKTVRKKTTPSKVKNPLPASHLFEVETPASPELGQNVTFFGWDLSKKTISMKVQENNNMDAFTWVAGIANAYDQARLHTHMAAHDMIYVTMFNQNKEKVALYRFAKLTLNAHCSNLDKESKGVLVHHVELSFERCEKDKEE